MITACLRKLGEIVSIVALGCCVLTLSGCWDRMEVNDLALITAAGFDRKPEGQIELSVQVFIPRSPGGQQSLDVGGGAGASGQTFIRSADGATIADAMARLQEKLPRRIFWGHCEIIVFGRKLAEAGIRPSADFLIRHPQVREGSFVFVGSGTAKAVLEPIPPLERSSSEVLRELAKSQIQLKVTLKDLLQRMIGDSGAVGLPLVKLFPSDDTNTPDQKVSYLTGTAVLRKDRLAGEVNDKVTRGILWLRDEIRLATVTIKPDEAPGYISMKLLRARTELIPSIDSGAWKMKVKAVTEDDIIQNGTTLDPMNPAIKRGLEDKLKRTVADNVQTALDRVQKGMKADIFGFADAFHRRYPKEWQRSKKRWEEIFPNVQVTFEITAKIRRPGMSTLPAGLPDEEVKRQ